MQHLLVADRTDFDAGVAGRAGPGRLCVKGEVEQRPRALSALARSWKKLVELKSFVDQLSLPG